MDKELEQISKVVESDLKKNYIKNMIQGFETANKMILDKINSGATAEKLLEDVKHCKLLMKERLIDVYKLSLS